MVKIAHSGQTCQHFQNANNFNIFTFLYTVIPKRLYNECNSSKTGGLKKIYVNALISLHLQARNKNIKIKKLNVSLNALVFPFLHRL
jgi:hypothetical protein